MAKWTQCRKMELSKTNFDIDLDLYDKLIPWLNRVPSALHLSCTPSWMRGGAPRPGALLSAPSALHPSCVPSWLTGQVEQSHFNDESHSLKEESVCETTNKRTYDFKFTKKNNIILIQDIQPPPTDLEIQQGYCQRPFCQTGQNRYICTICGKHFSYIGNFRIHQKNHTGIGLNCCQFCQKTFASRRNWKAHERSHTGERPYKCPTCPKDFANDSVYYSHRKKCALKINVPKVE